MPRALIRSWRKGFADRPSSLIHQVRTGEQRQNFTLSTVLRRSLRVADGLQKTLGVKRGSRVVILAEGFGDLVSVYHGLWIAGLCAVVIDPTRPIELVVSQIVNSSPTAIVYSSSVIAHLASIMHYLPPIDLWVSVGMSKARSIQEGKKVVRFEELFHEGAKNISVEDHLSHFDSDDLDNGDPLLVAFTLGDGIESHGAAFCEEKIVAAATNQSYVYNNLEMTGVRRIWSLLNEKSLVSILHNLLIPLMSNCVSIYVPGFDPRENDKPILDEVAELEVNGLLIPEEYISFLSKSFKTKITKAPKDFTIFLVPHSPVYAKPLNVIRDKLAVCYSQTELGGIVMCTSKGDIQTTDGGIVSSGKAIAGVTIKLKDDCGKFVEEGDFGEITVYSNQSMDRYYASKPGTCFLGADGSVSTADLGIVDKVDIGLQSFTVIGRQEDLIERLGETINLREIEATIKAIPGIVAAKVLVFPNDLVKNEIGAVVIKNKSADITRKKIWQILLENFEWESLPKEIFFQEDAKKNYLPCAKDLIYLFRDFSQSNFTNQNFLKSSR